MSQFMNAPSPSRDEFDILNSNITPLWTPSRRVNLGKNSSDHITGVKIGRLCFVCFNGAFWGFDTIPEAFAIDSASNIGYMRTPLIAGQGSARYLAHTEHGLTDTSLYIHANGGESQIPANGTYNVYGTFIYISANNKMP